MVLLKYKVCVSENKKSISHVIKQPSVLFENIVVRRFVYRLTVKKE
jgi:hypothetical protein